MRTFAFILAVLSILGSTRAAAATPVLLELFTSQSCSSCPPAEALLNRLLRSQPLPDVKLIGLSEHVDYWNRLGWRDPFSDPAFTRRQYHYAGDVFGGAEMYTPQLVVDGRLQAVGSNERAVLDAIRRAAANPPARIEVHAMRGAHRIAAELHLPALKQPAVLWLALTQNGISTRIGGGENDGRRLHEDAVTRSLHKLGETPANQVGTRHATLNLPDGTADAPLHVVAFAQAHDGSIVAVGAARVADSR